MSAAAEGVRSTELSPEAHDRSRIALQLLMAGALLGVMGDGLMRANPWGINFTLWTVTIVLALVHLRRRRGDLTPQERWLLVPVLFFASSFAWRDSELGFVDFLAFTLSAAILSRAGLDGPAWDIRRAQFREYVWAYLVSAGSVIAGVLPVLIAERPLATLAITGRKTGLAAFGRGALLAVPLLFVFGGLFLAADPAYEKLVTGVFAFDIGTVVGHVVLSGIFAWLSIGALRGPALVKGPLTEPAIPFSFALGRIELGVVLGSVNALFLSFVLVQLRYLFGGAELVVKTLGMTFAEYARHGFFELVFVALLVLPLLLLARSALPRGDAGALRLYRGMALSLLVLLGVVMASALQRMMLYQENFGLTLDRLVATTFMAWLALVFVWFVATVLRDRPAFFAFGGLVSGLVMLGVLNVANPSALVVRVNVGHASAGHELDVHYALSLGADAVPSLVGALDVMTPAGRCQAAHGLLRWIDEPSDAQWRDDWRTATVGRWRAKRAVRANAARLTPIRDACPKPVTDSH